MSIAEMQRHFTAYGSGELPEFELRSLIRSALAQEPQLSPACMALADAYRRANLIDAKLQSTINADIAEVTGPILAGLTMVRPPRANTPWISDGPAANSNEVSFVTRGLTGPEAAVAPNTDFGSFSLPTTGTGSTSGSKWDVEGGLAEVSTPLYPGSVIRDRFVLVEELGRGGMGVVYKAYDRSRGDVKDRYVAIKVLNEDFKRHPLAVRALQREARKAQRLAHPNVVAVHDFDRDGGNVYMVMELLSGRSLDRVLREDGQGGIPLGPAMDIIKSLASALSYAHEQDIVHCDFKPSNAFLGRDGKVKVLDFGIARAAPSLVESAETTKFDAGQLGAVSPAYASLEMLQREQPDVRDDVYAFACVAYELLTGCHPYQRLDAMKAFEMELQPRPIRKLSRTQWRALKQGLAFRRNDRCPTIDALARQLIAPPSRAKLWAGVAVAGVAAMALGAVIAWKWSYVQRTVGGSLGAAHSESGAAQSGAGASGVSGASGAPDSGAGSAEGSGGVAGAASRGDAGSNMAARSNAGGASGTGALSGSDAGANSSGARGTGAGSGATAGSGTTAGSGATAGAGTSSVWGTNTGARGASGATSGSGPTSGSVATSGSGATSGTGTTPGSGATAYWGTSATSGAGAISGATATPGTNTGSRGTSGSGAASGSSTPGGSSAGTVWGTTATPGAGSTTSSVGVTPGTNAGSAATGGISSGSGTGPGTNAAPGNTAIEMLKEQFETQAVAGDVAGATTSAAKLTRISAGSAYVTHEVPRILVLTYVHLAKTQLAGGQINAALNTLKEGRQKYAKSPELRDLEIRYVAAADIYDRLSSAVVLNVNDMKHALEELKTTEGDDYDSVAQMLAQTLADRIADQRAANRAPVADKLTEAGKQIFPAYTGMLGRGRAGVLSSDPIVVNEQ